MLGRDLLYGLQPFSSDCGLKRCETSQIATGVRQTIYKSTADGIANLGKDSRYCAVGLA